MTAGPRPHSRLIESPLAGAEQDARHLGQQIRPVARYLAELGRRRGDFELGWLTPAGMPLGYAIQAGNEQTGARACPARAPPGAGDPARRETLDLVRVGADGSPHWTRVWPAPEENPRHARLELWMAVYGYRIVSRPASAFDWSRMTAGHEPKVAWTSAASRTGT